MSLHDATEKKGELYNIIKQDPKYKSYLYQVTVDHLGKHKEVAKKRYYEHCLVIWLKKGYERKDITNRELKGMRRFGGLEVIVQEGTDE
jgi:hypothetical protein